MLNSRLRSFVFASLVPAAIAFAAPAAMASDKGNPEAKRIVAVGGTVQVWSRPGVGTTVLLTAPTGGDA